jgi:hypothetical protein
MEIIMMIKKMNLFLLLLLSNSFAFAGEEELMAEFLPKPMPRHTNTPERINTPDKLEDTLFDDELEQLFMKACTLLTQPESNADKERRLSDASRALSTMSFEKQSESRASASASKEASPVPRPIKILEKRHWEEADVDLSSPRSPYKPKAIKKRRISFDDEDQAMTTSKD